MFPAKSLFLRKNTKLCNSDILEPYLKPLLFKINIKSILLLHHHDKHKHKCPMQLLCMNNNFTFLHTQFSLLSKSVYLSQAWLLDILSHFFFQTSLEAFPAFPWLLLLVIKGEHINTKVI